MTGLHDVLMDTDEVVSPEVIEAMLEEALTRAYPDGAPLEVRIKKAGVFIQDQSPGDVPAIVRGFLGELPGLGAEDFMAIRAIYDRGRPG